MAFESDVYAVQRKVLDSSVNVVQQLKAVESGESAAQRRVLDELGLILDDEYEDDHVGKILAGGLE